MYIDPGTRDGQNKNNRCVSGSGILWRGETCEMDRQGRDGGGLKRRELRSGLLSLAGTFLTSRRGLCSRS